jgi:hypothetical protein
MMAAAMRPKVVLYNPPTVFWTMPLARWRVSHHEYGLVAERRLVEWLRAGRETS